MVSLPQIKNKGYKMGKKGIRVSDGTMEYASYAEAGRGNGFNGASLGYAFKHSKEQNKCEFRGKTWTKLNKLEKKSIPYVQIAIIVALAVGVYIFRNYR